MFNICVAFYDILYCFLDSHNIQFYLELHSSMPILLLNTDVAYFVVLLGPRMLYSTNVARRCVLHFYLWCNTNRGVHKVCVVESLIRL